MTLRPPFPGRLRGTAPSAALVFIDNALRGVGQAMFQNNRHTGLLFLLGIACNAPLLAAATLLGAAVATAVALLAGVDRAQVRDGLWGFSGALVALAALVFLRPDTLAWPWIWLCAVVAVAGSVAVTAALSVALRRLRIPAFTVPFVFVTWGVLLLAMHCGWYAPAPPDAVSTGAPNVSTLVEGTFNGVAQVFFQGNVVTGILVTLGLFIGSRSAGIAALAGSLAGALTAWSMGAAEPAIRAGMFGFNGALVAIALGSVFYAPGLRASMYALLATIVTPFAAAAVATLLQPFGLPALTLPFVLVSWACLLLGPALGMRPRS